MDFGEFIGTLLASLAHARRITDEESIAIAEHYKDNPLLEGISIPRVRVPELSIELPLLIKEFSEGRPSKMADFTKIADQVEKELRALLKQQETEVDLFDDAVVRFRKNMIDQLRKFHDVEYTRHNFQREHVAQIVDTSFQSFTDQLSLQEKFSSSQIKKMAAELRAVARKYAFKDQGQPPKLEVSFITAEIKDQAGPTNVVRLRLVMKEEGLEWHSVDQPDGTTRSTLTPE